MGLGPKREVVLEPKIRVSDTAYVTDVTVDPLKYKKYQIDEFGFKDAWVPITHWTCGAAQGLIGICTRAGSIWGFVVCGALEGTIQQVVCDFFEDWVSKRVEWTRRMKRLVNGNFTLVPEVQFRDPYGGVRTIQGTQVTHTGTTGGKYTSTVNLPCWTVAQGEFSGSAQLTAKGTYDMGEGVTGQYTCKGPADAIGAAALIYPITLPGALDRSYVLTSCTSTDDSITEFPSPDDEAKWEITPDVNATKTSVTIDFQDSEDRVFGTLTKVGSAYTGTVSDIRRDQGSNYLVTGRYSLKANLGIIQGK